MSHPLNPSPKPTLDEEVIVAIDRGIPGFPQLSSMAILPIDPDCMFVWFSATESAEVAFLAVNPFVHFPDYEVELSSLEEAALLVSPGDDLIVYCLVTIDRATGTATANLLAPLIINMSKYVAQQIILEGEHNLRARIPVPAMGPR